MATKKSAVYIWTCQILFIAMFAFATYVTFAEGTKVNGRRHQRRAQRESNSSPERIKTALLWTASLLVLAMAPLIVRFGHALLTDPAVPMIWNEGKARGRRFLNERFNNDVVREDPENQEKKTK